LTKSKTSKAPGSGLLAILEKNYGMSQETLERIGAFVVMWACFENYLERALWRLTGENPEGRIPSTDAIPISKLIARFREAGGGLEGKEWQIIVTILCDTADCLAQYRNALAHGQLLPASVGGGSILNSQWYGEQRKRAPVIAHIDENLVGLMLDALHELLIPMQAVAFGESPPNADPKIIGRQDELRRARSKAQEVRHLTEAMSSEKY
jgi:hypothetical protein